MNDRPFVEMVHGGHDAILKLLFGGDANMTQDRAGELGEKALDQVEPRGGLGQGYKMEVRVPQVQSIVSSVQCSGRSSTMRSTSPAGANALNPSRKGRQAAVARPSAVARNTSHCEVECPSAQQLPCRVKSR